MNIKKKLKKEKRQKNTFIIFFLVLIGIITYIALTLYNAGYFRGIEGYLYILAVIFVNLFFVVRIIKTISRDSLEYILDEEKIKIRNGLLPRESIIALPKILFVDIVQFLDINDFEILIIMEKGKRNKKFKALDEKFKDEKPYFSETYYDVIEKFKGYELCYYYIRRGGAKKYYLLYLLFKNVYSGTFSVQALNLVREFMEEYNL